MRVARRKHKLELEETLQFPERLTYLWSIFVDLSNTRTVTDSYNQPITYTEMVNFCYLERYALAPWEVSIIRRLDIIWMKVQNDARLSRT